MKKFDLVIGNPPYNKGMDLDFVKLGYNLSKEYTVMIIPAKWQTTADDYMGCASKSIDYKGFREQLVPHISRLVFYPDALDIFEVAQNDGITYFTMDKDVHDVCDVINKCVRQSYFNNQRCRCILHRETLNNIGNEIVESLVGYKKYEWKESDIHSDYYVATTALFFNSLGQGGSYDWDNMCIRKGTAGQGGLLLTKNGSVRVLGRSDILSRGDELKTSKKVTFQSNNKSECESFISWLYTKFTRFLLLINESQMNNAVKPDWFRFVPVPTSKKNSDDSLWDHVYTDEELYRHFNVSQKHIDIINAVIK